MSEIQIKILPQVGNSTATTDESTLENSDPYVESNERQKQERTDTEDRNVHIETFQVDSSLNMEMQHTLEVERLDEVPTSPVEDVVIQDDLVFVNADSIFGEISGPAIYDIKGKLVTPPIVAETLPNAFQGIPMCSRPTSKEHFLQEQEEKLRQFLGSKFDEEEFDKLAQYCSPENLKTGKEILIETTEPHLTLLPIYVSPENKKKMDDNMEVATKLQTVMCYKYLTGNYTNTLMKKLKYRGMRFIPPVQRDVDSFVVPAGSTPLIPGRDTLFRVRIYRPFGYDSQWRLVHSRHSVFMCDLVLLGRQKLTCLRDRFVCPNDASMRTDVSDNPEQPDIPAKDVFPSGFLFINNVFYVDSRPGCTDTSVVVRRWAAARGMGNFPVRDMDVEVSSVKPRLGHPDVYVHQGKCEHLFTFSEVRLLNPTDPLSLEHYPCHTAVSRNQTIYCTTCASFASKWVVTECERVPFDPAFFCDICFKSYLYVDGKKIGHFKAYTFKGNEINVFKPPTDSITYSS